MAGNSNKRPEIWPDMKLEDREHGTGYSIREQENTEVIQLEDQKCGGQFKQKTRNMAGYLIRGREIWPATKIDDQKYGQI